MIPKIIHYCWFGNNPKSSLINKCIASWHKYCPDWEFVEWNESNFDINCCCYVKEAYESKKWAFVSDYCRFYALNKMGGIYLDTDVELLKPLDEYRQSPFMAFEEVNKLNPGLICGCEAADVHCKNLLDEYNGDYFINPDGTLNLRTVCDRATDEFVKYGLVLNNTLQDIDTYKIYPTDYFNPYSMKTGKITIKPITVSVHHYAGSWESPYRKLRGRVYRMINRFFGEKAAKTVRKMFAKK